MSTTIIVKGTLHGMGFEAECSLLATRSNGGPDASAVFTRCVLLDAPSSLPDGLYEATFSDQTAFLHRANGIWSAGIPWRQHRVEVEDPFEHCTVTSEPEPHRMQAAAK